MNKIQYYKEELDLNEIISQNEFVKSPDPLYIVDLSEIIRLFKIWTRVMPQVQPYFTVKSNDHPMVLRLLSDLGSGFNCVSRNELAKVHELKIAPERVLYGNAVKPIAHLLHAKRYRIHTMIYDNEYELFKIKKYYPNAKLLLRINCCSIENYQQTMQMISADHGCDARQEGPHLLALARELQLNVIGVAFHAGSKCTDYSIYHKAISNSKMLFEFGRCLGFDMNTLDIGGGFTHKNSFNSLIRISEVIRNALDEFFPNGDLNVIAEPGRFLVESSHTLVCKIQSKEEVLVDGGNKQMVYHINDGVLGSFHSSLYEKKIYLPKFFWDDDADDQQHLNSKVDEQLKTFKSYVMGPSSDPMDKICENIFLPSLDIGSALIFENMGAYTLPTIRAVGCKVINRLSNCKFLFFCNEREKFTENSATSEQTPAFVGNELIKFLG